jgi:hypothetical protein
LAVEKGTIVNDENCEDSRNFADSVRSRDLNKCGSSEGEGEKTWKRRPLSVDGRVNA